MQVKIRFDGKTVSLKVTKPNKVDEIKVYEKGNKPLTISGKASKKMILSEIFDKLDYTYDARRFDADSWTPLTLFHALIMSPDIRVLQYADVPKLPELEDGEIP